MRSLTEFIATIIEELNASKFPYVVTGSYASIAYSEPRTTVDIDFVVHAPLEGLEAFRGTMIDLGLYVPSISATTDTFNVLDPESQWKADIILWQDEPFEASRFARRVEIELLPGVTAYIPTVEDMILAKLRWIEGRDSPLQLRDIASMIEMNRDALDLGYLRTWAADLGVSARLEELLRTDDA